MASDNIRLVTPEAMGRIDAAAIDSGIDGYALMRNAGAHVAACVLAQYPDIRRAVVLCGPGNNGGDGHVAARLLMQSGVPTQRFGTMARAGKARAGKARAGGDAAKAEADCPGEMLRLEAWQPQTGDVIIDALFGAGLDRPVKGDIAAVIARVGASGAPVVAVDLPSGVSGRTGLPTGPCLQAAHTVTFAALKPGHLLMPGKTLCGTTHLCDIGIPARLIASHEPVWRNHPGLYSAHLPAVSADQHKYSRGHLVVLSGPLISGGAARLAATAGLRAGAGLVSLGTPPGAVMSQAAHLTAIMQQRILDCGDLESWLSDQRLSAFVLGPGFGAFDKARSFATTLAGDGRPLVLDADGLSAFADDRAGLAALFGGQNRLVITPHEGEFRRLFPGLGDDGSLSKIDRARMAAEMLNAVVIYKGPDTVIAAPDGRVAVNTGAPAWLATAGSGDVLTGTTGGLIAQGMPLFEAGCAAVAMHGAAAGRCGPNMTAEDLADHIGRV